MLITPVSTASISETARVTLMRAQSSMADAQKELASGRYADIGLAIGARTSQTISFRQEFGGLATLQDTNRILSSRLQLTQSALSDISATADRFLNAALAAFSSEQGVAAAKLAAQDALKFMTGALNTAHDGAFVFAGLNTDVPPVADYFGTPVPASKQAVDLAFITEFGVAQSAAGTEAITGSDALLSRCRTHGTCQRNADPALDIDCTGPL